MKKIINEGETIFSIVENTKPLFTERLIDLPDYNFNVLEDLELPYQICKNDKGEWGIMYCNDIIIKDDEIYCAKSCFNEIKNNKDEFSKFKEWLDDQPVNIVYAKNNQE